MNITKTALSLLITIMIVGCSSFPARPPEPDNLEATNRWHREFKEKTGCPNCFYLEAQASPIPGDAAVPQVRIEKGEGCFFFQLEGGADFLMTDVTPTNRWVLIAADPAALITLFLLDEEGELYSERMPVQLLMSRMDKNPIVLHGHSCMDIGLAFKAKIKR